MKKNVVLYQYINWVTYRLVLYSIDYEAGTYKSWGREIGTTGQIVLH